MGIEAARLLHLTSFFSYLLFYPVLIHGNRPVLFGRMADHKSKHTIA